MFFVKHKRYLPVYLCVVGILSVWAVLGMSFTGIEATDETEKIETRVLRADVNQITQAKELINEPLLFLDVNYGTFYDIAISNDFVSKLNTFIDQLDIALTKDDYTASARESMKLELARLNSIKTAVESDINHYIAWENEHYYTTKVWEYFMQRGYGEVVTSAIIGNMMVETAGGTLNLNPNAYSASGNYYGLCQWSLYYYPSTKDLPFEHQLDYLVGDMPYQFNTFGKCYKSGFDYESFLAMKDPAEAALAFAKSYERCSSISYAQRVQAAQVAYDYFNLNN